MPISQEGNGLTEMIKILANIHDNGSKVFKTLFLIGIAVFHAAISIYISYSVIRNSPLLYEIYKAEQVYWIFFVDSILAFVNITACIGLLIQRSFGFWFSTSYFSYKAMRSIYEAIFINNVFSKLKFDLPTLINLGIPLLLLIFSVTVVFLVIKNYCFGGKLSTVKKVNISLAFGVMLNLLCILLGWILSGSKIF